MQLSARDELKARSTPPTLSSSRPNSRGTDLPSPQRSRQEVGAVTVTP